MNITSFLFACRVDAVNIDDATRLSAEDFPFTHSLHNYDSVCYGCFLVEITGLLIGVLLGLYLPVIDPKVGFRVYMGSC